MNFSCNDIRLIAWAIEHDKPVEQTIEYGENGLPIAINYTVTVPIKNNLITGYLTLKGVNSDAE